jgi:hypothetical protein
MDRNSARIPRDDWREHLFWTSLAAGLIAFLLFGLVALSQWGERAEATPMPGVSAPAG